MGFDIPGHFVIHPSSTGTAPASHTPGYQRSWKAWLHSGAPNAVCIEEGGPGTGSFDQCADLAEVVPALYASAVGGTAWWLIRPSLTDNPRIDGVPLAIPSVRAMGDGYRSTWWAR